MSKALLNEYYNAIHNAKLFGGSKNETSIRTAFINLVNGMAKNDNLLLVPELSLKTSFNTTVRPDGILRNALQLDNGFWESKDEKDDIEDEIRLKFSKGYPNSNIIFEDTVVSVLFQNGDEVMRCKIEDGDNFLKLLNAFIKYERPEVKEFKEAIGKFGDELPKILEALRSLIAKAGEENPKFQQKRNEFLRLCQNSINPKLDLIDVREMLIQHILTEDIFVSVFSQADYHRDNNVAKLLYEVERTFFKGETKENLLYSVRPYYDTIKSRANQLVTHDEKQKFLKAVYENFYQAYNPKGADVLGIVYTPNEIVRFIIQATDYLLEKNFNKVLSDKGVEILDPCTGTGTFITEIIEHIPAHLLPFKYEKEIHANELALLPYYVANLNIEKVYQNKMQLYKEFKNLCLTDTLDNYAAVNYAGKQIGLEGSGFSENIERILAQNERKISVIIGNPPYNAKQENYNFQNANRAYKEIDSRIKETYIKTGTAQNQIVIYDMYVRFLRWATDRLNKNGIIAFVSNNSFIDSAAFDGFRKLAAKDFQEIWILNTKGNARTSGERRRMEKGNVFNDKIRVGVAVYFLVKNEKKSGCRIFYHEVEDYWSSELKLEYINFNKFAEMPFERIVPDEKGVWINQTDNDFEELIPIIDKDVKAGKSEKAIFELFSRGLVSQRDEWVYDFSKNALKKKMFYFTDIYKKTLKNNNFEDKFKIKWDEDMETYLTRKIQKQFDDAQIIESLYRPFSKKWFYFDKHFNGRTYQWYNIYNPNENLVIAFSGLSHTKSFSCLSLTEICDLGFIETCQCLPLYRYSNGERKENITDWALEIFRNKYVGTADDSKGTKGKKGKKAIETTAKTIEKTDIFHYVYAVLHNPEYRKKYEQNLKRDFPRIPMYADFWKWAEIGKKLMDLHLHYETVEKWDLGREEVKLKNPDAMPKAKLKADKTEGKIYIDDFTTLTGVPAQAWEYKLGNRSALEWILDQYKESTPSDATIAAQFNTYKFADYKEQVIDLLMRVCRVSVETVAMMQEMEGLE